MKRLVQVIAIIFALLALYPLHAMSEYRHCREFSQTIRAGAYWVCGAIGWTMYGMAAIALIIWIRTEDWDAIKPAFVAIGSIYVIGGLIHFSLGNPQPRNNPIR